MAIVVSTPRIRIDRFVLGPFSTNSYVITCRETAESLVVDAPGDVGKIVTALRQTRPRCILITHGHMDHISGLVDLQKAVSLPVAVHPGDAAALPVHPDNLLGDGDLLPLGAIQLQVLHTPGHTP